MLCLKLHSSFHIAFRLVGSTCVTTFFFFLVVHHINKNKSKLITLALYRCLVSTLLGIIYVGVYRLRIDIHWEMMSEYVNI